MTPMLRAAAALTAALTAAGGATGAAALSCLANDPARAYAEADAAPQDYVVLSGMLTFDDSRMPSGAIVEPSAPPGPIPGDFAGSILTAEGFSRPWSGPIILHPTCAGPWCGRLSSPLRAMVFAINDETGPVVIVDPCLSKIFADPSRETLASVVACMQDGGCTSSD